MISLERLGRNFGSHRAVENLTLTISPGEIVGILGPNGAGKTTTMRLLSGYLAPTSGSIKIHTLNMAEQTRKAQALIGYLPEGAPSYGDMTVKEYLTYIAKVRGLSKSECQESLVRVINELALNKVQNQLIETLSKGFQRRVALAQAIIHDPKVLLLDEPTDGLDPNQKHHIRALIRQLAENRIIIISTHILEEVSALCTRCTILNDGRLVFDGEPQELIKQSKFHNAVTLEFKWDLGAHQPWQDLDWQGIDGVHFIETQNQSITLFPKHGKAIFPQVYHFVQQHQLSLGQITVEKGRLEDVFQHLTQAKVVAQ